MPEEINRVVADHISFGVPRAPAHEEVALEFGFEFDGKRAAGISGVSAAGGQGLALTDSGGGREETCILLGVMLRENAERPETVDVGANVLAGVSVIEMLEATKQMLS